MTPRVGRSRSSAKPPSPAARWLGYLQPDRCRSGACVPAGTEPHWPQQRAGLQALVQRRLQRHGEFRDRPDGELRFLHGLTLTSVTGYSNYSLMSCAIATSWAPPCSMPASPSTTTSSARSSASPPRRPDRVMDWRCLFPGYGLSEHDYLHVPTTSLVMPVLTSALPANRALPGTAGHMLGPGRRVHPMPCQPARLQAGPARVYSVFAQATWRINDPWAGVRWPLHLRGQGRLADHHPDPRLRWARPAPAGIAAVRLGAGHSSAQHQRVAQ